jgi:hypothetical protein
MKRMPTIKETGNVMDESEGDGSVRYSETSRREDRISNRVKMKDCTKNEEIEDFSPCIKW